LKNKITVIGSGLSAITVAKLLIKNGHRVCLVSSGETNSSSSPRPNNFFSARIDRSTAKKNDGFISSNGISTKNFEVFGLNSPGGLSNVWGGGFIVDYNYIKEHDINLKWEKLKRYFFVSKRKKSFIPENLSNSNDTDFKFSYPKFLFKRGTNQIYNAKDDLKELKRHRRFVYIKNCFVRKIKRNDKGLIDIYTDTGSKPIISSKEVIFASGTISTTRILVNFLKLQEKTFRLKHNPNLAILGILKSKIKNTNTKVIGNLMFECNLNNYKVAGLIGPISDDIINIISKKIGLIPSFLTKFILNCLKNRLFVANCFISNELSNSTICVTEKMVEIEGGFSKKYKKFEKKIIKKIRKNFSSFSHFTGFYRLPLGSDIHYTGTIDRSNHLDFTLKKNYELQKEKNIYVVDGSIIKGNPIYPGLYILNVAIDFVEKYQSID
tara:strand:- start:6521 stop:7831 length:1311 start_codon:yes stop_codon:yes gene_type:complete